MTKQPVSRTRAPSTRKRASAKGAPLANVSHDDIARRAYQIYLARAPHEGDALDDWFRAEQELIAPML